MGNGSWGWEGWVGGGACGSEFSDPVGVGGAAVLDVIIGGFIVGGLAGGVGLPFVGEIPADDFDDGEIF